MATPSSLNMCASNAVIGACNVSKTQKVFMSCSPDLFGKKLVNSMPICSSADFTPLRCSFGVKPVKWESNGEVSTKFGAPCRVVGVKSTNLFSVGQKFQLNDVLEAQQFDRDTLNAIFEVAREMEKVEKNSPGSQVLKGYLMATLFYEPSTRTRLSFESAMKRLGGEVLTTENAREFSSAAKGETLEGRYQCITSFAIIVIGNSLMCLVWM